jgi:TonB family protein
MFCSKMRSVPSKCILAFLSFGLCLPVRAFPQSQSGSATQPSVSIPHYPDSQAGLKKMIQDILAATKASNTPLLDAYWNALVIPQYNVWFRQVFGDEAGGQFAEAYGRATGGFGPSLSRAFLAMVLEKLSDVEVQRFDQGCDPDANEDEYPLLAVRQKPVPFYEVRVVRNDSGRLLWFFVYVDGAFRFGANLRVTGLRFIGGPPPTRALRVGGAVQQAKLIHSPRPAYPDQAKRARIQGTVKLQAIIDTEGNVRGLQVLSGRCSLARSAIEAVRQWRYTPTLLEGKPVDVIATIDVVYSLRW